MTPNVTFHPHDDELSKNARALVADGKGLLAADESLGSIEKRFESVGKVNTEENRRDYRDALLTAKGHMERYIGGVILFTEQLTQKTSDGVSFPEILARRGILAGGKTDLGAKPLTFGTGDKGETATEGLDGLLERSQWCYKHGARFAKWRATYVVGAGLPSAVALQTNADTLARFASISQKAGLVPVVEPEILTDGAHDLQESLDAHIAVLGSVFESLRKHNVRLDATILKPSMVLPGEDYMGDVSVQDIANATLAALAATVPPAIPGIVFLSGGQSSHEAIVNLDAINKAKTRAHAYHPQYSPFPWNISFSFGRALQADALKTWAEGKKQQAGVEFINWAKKSHEAALGEFEQ